jgi:hypothetical protein
VQNRDCEEDGVRRFPHPALDEEINRNFIRSEIEGGVYLERLPPGTELEVRTENRSYRIRYCGDGRVLISGHPVFCPEPVLVKLHGSTWGGAVMRSAYIGRGMHLEFRHPEHQVIVTSAVLDIRDKACA